MKDFCRFLFPTSVNPFKAVILIVLFFSSAVITAQITAFNTGVDNSGNLLPAGNTDPHYSLVVNPDGSGSTSFVVVNNGFPLGCCWFADGPNSQWIAPQSLYFTFSGDAVGIFDYQTTFNVTGDPSKATLSGQWATDNEGIDILINGQSTGNTIPAPNQVGFASFTPFTINGGFVAGTNTLDFIVHNDGGPTGLRVEFQPALKSCQVNLALRQSQGGAQWKPPLYPSNYVSLNGLVNPWGTSAFTAFHAYDFSFDCPNSNGNKAACTSTNFQDIDTLGKKGCALTSLEMALANKNVVVVPFKIPLIPPTQAEIDIPLDPGSMNLWMTGNGGFTTNGKVKWDMVTRRLGAAISLRFDTSNWNSSDPKVLMNQVCQGDKGRAAPVVVGVNINDVEIPLGTGNFVAVPGHYVLVTGEMQNPDGTTTFSIADPAGRGQTLDAYSNDFLIRGLVTDPLDRSGLDIYTGDNVEMSVTDPLGRRTGFDSSTTTDLREIPTAAYLRDALTDDVTRALDSAITRSVEIYQPSPGSYRINVAGLGVSSYTLDINAFASDGSALPTLTVSGISGSGSMSAFDLGLTGTPGAVINVTRVASFDSTLGDIANSLQLNLIESQGVANALSSKINAASAAAAGGDNKTATNILSAFVNQVNAQSGKHINGIATEVLIEDANYLISLI